MCELTFKAKKKSKSHQSMKNESWKRLLHASSRHTAFENKKMFSSKLHKLESEFNSMT